MGHKLGRKDYLLVSNSGLLDATTALRRLRAKDVKNRKAKLLARLKPKFTQDIKEIDLLLETIVLARKILRGLPKAVQ